jgi:hypothetical protein
MLSQQQTPPAFNCNNSWAGATAPLADMHRDHLQALLDGVEGDIYGVADNSGYGAGSCRREVRLPNISWLHEPLLGFLICRKVQRMCWPVKPSRN